MSRLFGLLLGIAALGLSGWLASALLTSNLPSVENLGALVHGRLALHSAPYTHLDEISPLVQQTTVITEDSRFLSHGGVDPLGILRAILDNLMRRCLCEGGSTIPQQLAKQIYFDGDDGSPRRKLDATLLAIEIDRRYSKDQILEFYLNTAYYGHSAFGVGAASQAYWGRPASKADLAEAAMLAGLPQAPSSYDPISHPAAGRQRRSEVLTRLIQSGLITREQARVAAAQPVSTAHALLNGTIRDLRASLQKEKPRTPTGGSL